MTRHGLRTFLFLIFLAGTALASTHTEGGKTALVLVSQYPDELVAKTESQLQADFDVLFKIGQSGGIDDFYRRNSYGKTWFTSIKVRKVTLPNPKANYSGNYGLAMNHALTAAGESSNNYSRTMSIAAGTISSTGLACVGGTYSFYNQVQGAAIFNHELGHNWGNWHANFWKPNGADPLDGTYLEYGNAFDNMGGGSGDWNGVKKAGLDFLTANATDGTRVLAVSTSGTYRLATVGTPYAYSVAASEANGDTPAFTAAGWPSWLTLTDHANGTATLAGTPATPGTFAVTLRATSAGGATDQAFTVIAEPSGGNLAPVFTSAPPSASFQPGGAYSYLITASDANGTVPALVAVRLPSWLALTDHGNGTATLAGTVPDTTIARFDIELAATDGIATTAQAFAITLDRQPVVTILNPARRAIGLPDRADTLLLEAAASDPEGAPLSLAWSVQAAPAGGEVAFADASSATTTATFSTAGRYRLRLSASDASGSGTAELDVFVETNGTSAVLANALLGHWPVTEAAGLTTLADASGNNRTLTLGSGLDSVIATGGISGNAAAFAGTANTYAENTALTQTAKTSLSFWLRPAAAPAPAEQTVVNLNNGGTSRLRVYRQTGSSRLRVTADFGSADGVWEITGDLPANQWTHVVVAYDYTSTATNPSAYLNGTAATVARITAPTGTVQSMANRIRLADGNSARLAGALDEVRVYQEIVTAAEAAALCDRANERTANLAAYWRFDETAGTTVAADSSGNNLSLLFGSGVAALTTTAGYEGNGVNLNAANLAYGQASVTQPNQATVALWFRFGGSPSATGANLWTLLNGAASRLRVYRPANDRRLRVATDWGTTDGVWRIERDIPASQWLHLAVAYDRSSVSNTPVAYLNGLPVPLTTLASPAGAQQSAATVLRVGADGNAANRFFGRFDELRVHNRLVPADEIPLLMLPNGINQAPDVDAGQPVEIAANSTITLAGTAIDDGQPAATAAVTFQWSLLSGPVGSALGSPSSPDSTFTTGPSPGLYTLRLAATDGEANVFQPENGDRKKSFCAEGLMHSEM